MCSETSLPLPLDPLPPPEAEDRRLWIGNLDSRLTEYHLIKLLQQYGKVTKFDFLFHKSGPLKGQPRGYCFVTYEEKDQAENALLLLNGKAIMKKSLLVKWAHTVPSEEACSKKLGKAVVATEEGRNNKNVYSQINAIEAKLKAMEEQQDKELEICLSAVPSVENPIWQQTNRVENRPNYHRTRDGPYTRTRSRYAAHPRYTRRR